MPWAKNEIQDQYRKLRSVEAELTNQQAIAKEALDSALATYDGFGKQRERVQRMLAELQEFPEVKELHQVGAEFGPKV